MLRKLSIVFLLILTSPGIISANFDTAKEQPKQEVVFADAGWDSVKFHNAVAGFIGTHAYNITPKIISGSTPIIQTALLRGDVDVHMELWTDNVPTFEADMKTGKLLNLGINFDDDKQGLYVPRYLIEGDAKRGIKPLAPDLKTVKDLARYAHLFKDPEDPSKGRLYGAIPGWSIDKILYLKYEAYGLNKNYVYFRSGSEPALNSAFLAAYTKGEPIVGYNYEPTWLTGKLSRGIIYGIGLFAIGAFGYWSMMNETLAVVISSVIISLLLGLPIGILVSTSRLANSLLRPLLDAMQTMPTFVYMIPAVMLLGPGKVPAVLATVVYAIVPVIRLTSHGIQQVDPNVVEASAAFGASRWQTLFKVQIPQAMPTIMTGINQTMMMAVAMVVTCAMIGANGLGMEVLIAINRTESGRGLIAGISIVIIAIIIDRLTQSLADKKKEGK